MADFEFHYEFQPGEFQTVQPIRESDSKSFYICEDDSGNQISVHSGCLYVFAQLSGDDKPKRHRIGPFEEKVKAWLIERQEWLREQEIEEAVQKRLREMGYKVEVE